MKPGRNEPCPCGSGRKYKHCCGQVTAAVSAAAPAPTNGPSAAVIGELVGLLSLNRLQDAELKALVLIEAHPHAGMLWKILGLALMRQNKDALQTLRRASELLPLDAEAHANLGAYLCDHQQWASGLASLRRALELQPRNEQTLVDAANATKALGQVRDSIPLYRQALEINPRFAEAHNNLGNAFLEIGQYHDAARCYRLALALRPNDADIHCNLGNAQRELGLSEDAIASSRRAIALEPTLSVAHNNLGLVLAGRGQLADAAASFRNALRFNPGYVEALHNLAAILPELGERREAVTLLTRAIELDPKRAQSYVHLGNLLFESRKIEEAESNYRRALLIEPHNALAHADLGAALRMQGKIAEAESSCRAALEADANCVAALWLLGELSADRGQFAAANEYFQRVIAIDPAYAFAYYSIAVNRRMTSEDSQWLQGVEALLAKPLPLRQEVSLRYGLGKYFDDLKQYDAAFDSYRKANELTKRYGNQYDRTAMTERVDRVIASFDAASIGRLQAYGSPSERPVLIVGMPRSGTSLTEQILSSHPDVFGAGELRFWQTAFGAYENSQLTNDALGQVIPDMAQGYLARLTALSSNALRVVDKMPQNFIHLGLICAAFPNARIIHVTRHPIDTCLSIYFQYFSHLHPYANDLQSLAHFYADYVRLMAHWRAALPAGMLLEVPYEALIADQVGWTRGMLEFIALPWEPRCLDFHQTDRTVITLSKWQVRQKIHGSSAGRWRHYEKHVGPLLPLIELTARYSEPTPLADSVAGRP
jgi:tetratricopeptide (TPR) repeat protein